MQLGRKTSPVLLLLLSVAVGVSTVPCRRNCLNIDLSARLPLPRVPPTASTTLLPSFSFLFFLLLLHEILELGRRFVHSKNRFKDFFFKIKFRTIVSYIAFMLIALLHFRLSFDSKCFFSHFIEIMIFRRNDSIDGIPTVLTEWKTYLAL